MLIQYQLAVASGVFQYSLVHTLVLTCTHKCTCTFIGKAINIVKNPASIA